ncbi:MAG: 3'-5' exonuclease, partial [Candidatus Veblenbacteria bacterium]|nr:3'-5' exonuclease [Candidatus Veblenbacteria bacterium]
PPHFSIYDADDQLGLVKEVMKEQGIGLTVVSPRAVLAAISRAKAELVTPEDYADWADEAPFVGLVAELYPRYQQLLMRDHAFDFDDLLMRMVQVWQAQPELLKAYQDRFRYLLVDEYQDVNRAQYVWTKLLAQGSGNLCVVGDDWQSIYSWRGADFGNILRFEQDYPNATVIKLEQNYRSTKVIISAGNAIMARAQMKADKTLWTENQLGERILVVNVENEEAEARYVVREVVRLAGGKNGRQASGLGMDEGVQREAELTFVADGEESEFLPGIAPLARYHGTGEELKDFAVLYRTNAQSRALEEACLRAGLPYQLIGGTRFYERREVKDMLAYLRLLVNPFDAASFRRAILAPTRGLGLASVEQVVQAARERQVSLPEAAVTAGVSGNRGRALKQFSELVAKLGQVAAHESVAELMEAVLTESGLKQELLDSTAEGEARYQNVQELKTVAEARSPGKGKEALESFLTEISLWQDQDSFNKNKQGLTLMTFHAAKGLEFTTVFLVGMEEGLFPHASSFNDPRELEEERRLAYVGLTRARERVYCLYALNRRLFGGMYPGLPSRFLGELPEECVESISASRLI